MHRFPAEQALVPCTPARPMEVHFITRQIPLSNSGKKRRPIGYPVQTSPGDSAVPKEYLLFSSA